jgi:DNA-binding winged helix-turn-helix (wHTH) protein
LNGASRLCQRRWLFAGAVFDEANWTLVVDGRRVSIEAKPLELLRELLLQAGKVVTKDQLLDRIWPEVHVVEASLPTAVRKLRLALGDDRHDRTIVETVPGIGYRISVPVELDDRAPDLDRQANGATAAHYAGLEAQALAARQSGVMPRVMIVAAGLAIGLAAIVVAFSPTERVDAARPAHVYTQQEAMNALRKLDVEAVEKMIAAGWDPAAPFDSQGNDALKMVLNTCEWDPLHDQRKLQLIARTLLDGGAPLARRNFWGDTAYSIAKADRFCGPRHPVTRMLRTLCYAGYKPFGDRCLATYELTAAQRKAQGLPPA